MQLINDSLIIEISVSLSLPFSEINTDILKKEKKRKLAFSLQVIKHPEPLETEL